MALSPFDPASKVTYAMKKSRPRKTGKMCHDFLSKMPELFFVKYGDLIDKTLTIRHEISIGAISFAQNTLE
uniref:Integrase n=1 Tax=Panagrellus redivivus TaxID=6233 RepID=A0A7E4UWQ6_PANRE